MFFCYQIWWLYENKSPFQLNVRSCWEVFHNKITAWYFLMYQIWNMKIVNTATKIGSHLSRNLFFYTSVTKFFLANHISWHMHNLHSFLKYYKIGQIRFQFSGLITEINDSQWNSHLRLLRLWEARIQMSDNACSFMEYFRALAMMYQVQQILLGKIATEIGVWTNLRYQTNKFGWEKSDQFWWLTWWCLTWLFKLLFTRANRLAVLRWQ